LGVGVSFTLQAMRGRRIVLFGGTEVRRSGALNVPDANILS